MEVGRANGGSPGKQGVRERALLAGAREGGAAHAGPWTGPAPPAAAALESGCQGDGAPGRRGVGARRPRPHPTTAARPVLTQDTTRRMVCGCRTRVWGSKAPPALPAPYAPPSIVAAPRGAPRSARAAGLCACACAAPSPFPRAACAAPGSRQGAPCAAPGSGARARARAGAGPHARWLAGTRSSLAR